MKQLTVTIFVSPATAALAGRSTCGEVPLALSDADLAALTATQRETLAQYLSSGSASLRELSCAVAEASVATLASLLDARAAELAARASAELAAREAELAVFEGCAIEALYTADDRPSRGPTPKFPRSGGVISLVELLGRQQEGAAMIQAVEQREKDRVAAKVAAEVAAEAARAAKAASDRAELRAFLAPHLDAVGMAWFDALEDPEDARPEVRRAISAAISDAIAGVVGGAAGFYLLPDNARIGLANDPITDLAVYRRVGQLVVAVGEALGGDIYKGASAEVENVTLWRDAEDGEDGDEDGEVAEYEWIRIRCEVGGGLAVNFYTR
jgi:hypothetical protein